MADCEITPAAVRLYGRCLDIECEVEEAIADGDWMTTEELLAWSDRVLRDDNLGSAPTTSIRLISIWRRNGTPTTPGWKPSGGRPTSCTI